MKIFKFFKARYAPRGARQSFSQAGEDLIMSDILKKMHIERPSYIDIGAHDPVFGSNTYLLYRNGGRGVLVEPNTAYTAKIESKRPRDVCINAGAGKIDGIGTFYAFDRSTRSTFSKHQAEEWQKSSGQKPVVEKKKIISLNTIVRDHVKNQGLDILSIDAEGVDVEILEGYNWSIRPKVICVENQDEKVLPILQERGYILVAQIFQNYIFVDKK
jgi:FkbM family methyltransferase